MSKRIYLSPPHMGGEELTYIHQAFDTNWVSPAGPHIDTFEKELATYNGMEYCAALSSGTAAIHLALIILGIKHGDEVICSTFTFSGSCNPIAYVGAIPVFVDSELETWNMDPVLLEEAILDRIRKGKKPKAIILVHLYGMPAKLNELMAISRKYEIPVIEDAAEALGSTYFGQKAGTFGDFGVYSFNGNKIITTSGGGALVSKNEDWIKRARFLATQARDAAPHYQHSEIGYNYRLSNISAGIGLGQLKVLDDRVRQRRANFDFYQAALSHLPGIAFQPEMSGSFANRWLTTMLIDPSKSGGVTREDIRLALEKENIESRPLWKPMHLQPIFQQFPNYGGGVSEKLFEQGLCLPSGSALKEDELRIMTILILDLLS
ncbi:MAG: aminotransferase class I/II-fold pyridoxal phosphate-dependent enzyme [Cytophagales bacterium]|jgi:dTDP-4-amino-4,6-dideoxygalactose transaminase|nr:aminotransferase class I/II-fold pyridoxal phosphate-dependent enzyme [Cytophagales bacterium]MCA6388667.1 aminotransferase class I/II-fold pyridoxal phosphate-dependent enzyme [Cytophagales bacterium]MCA6393303.1 aminotransferase class I/II-fold pyridoxal phosphate-dependent enzyme [Cytophagales bacterium]MCA6396169.1 aminotransferase class I/II-fold pyridoxal phosphate-dependent enzyme [Cytophagales bacterium]MCA6398025.1 aminotransferase class I/II-fold pyridoxal phosphate-dependent enzym